jgi:hypothetical protein
MENLPFTLNSLLTTEPPEGKRDNLPTPAIADTYARELRLLYNAAHVEMTLRNLQSTSETERLRKLIMSYPRQRLDN